MHIRSMISSLRGSAAVAVLAALATLSLAGPAPAAGEHHGVNR